VAKPELLGVKLPLPPSPDGTPDHGPASICVAIWEPALTKKLADEVRALPLQARRCLVAWMFKDCARTFAELDDSARKQGTPVLHARRFRAALQTAAEDFAREACRTPLAPEQVHLLERLRAALAKSNRESER
jgi:hypothetical protein